MLGIDDRVTPAALDQFIQALLAFDEWQTPQVLTIEPQQIESIEDGLALAGHQFVKFADAITVETDNFAVENSVLDGQLIERFLQEIEGFEVVQVATDESARAVLDVGYCTKTIMLQFENVVRIVEWFRDVGKAHRLDAGEHYPSRCRAA
jgi:hypothetical protein